MPEKTVSLPSHKKFIASLNEVAPAFDMIGKNAKKLKTLPTGVQATVVQFRKLVTWFGAHEAEYGVLTASAQAAPSKPKAAKAGG